MGDSGGAVNDIQTRSIISTGEINANDVTITGTTTTAGLTSSGALSATNVTGSGLLTVTSTESITNTADVGITTLVTLVSNTAGATTGGMANGTVGQLKFVSLIDGTGINYALTPTLANGYATITFATAGQGALLVYTSAGWAIVTTTGVVS